LAALEFTPVVISTPPDFPVEWASPEDEKLPLTQDRQHAPSVITPLSGWVCEEYWGTGSTRGFAAAGQPIEILIKRINAYYYYAAFPRVAPEDMEAAGKHAEETVKALIPTYADRWENEWLPELKGYHRTWDSFDLAGASDDDLLAHLEWTFETYVRIWDIHMEVTVGYMTAPSMFDDLYEDLFGSEHALDSYTLLQGFENASLKAAAELWSIANTDMSDELRSLILKTPSTDLVSTLNSSQSGNEFLARLRTYLGEYGKRSDNIVELMDPSWVEDPTIAFDNLKNYLDDGAEDPDVHRDRLVTEREKAVAGARDKLSAYPAPIQEQFEGLLSSAQHGHRIQEDHNWWIDQMGTHQVRHVFLEFGRRLAASGAIGHRDDIFFLLGNEIKDEISSYSASDFSETIAQRKTYVDKWSKVPAPVHLGTDYGPRPDGPYSRALGRFFGGSPPPADPGRPDVIKGFPGSPGKFTGTARVIIKLSDAGRLGKGEILVTPTTAPPWTPLFATAGGIVTDTGGPLSHCAIVAREYGLPAVVGTGMATSVIQDGQQIEVNGDSGEVRVI
jgi:rifampicin phosphotransferase